MRKPRIVAASAVSAAAAVALGLAAPAAVARDGMTANPRNVVVQPSVIARGGQITVSVDGCPAGGHMTSSAFPQSNLTPVNGVGQSARGTATINDNARPGPYDITVYCSGQTLTAPAAFTVIGGVRGGLGGSSSTGATPTDMAIGGGLVAAAAAGGALFWMRRRSERRA
ncbi:MULTISPECIES: hypothetical protein [Streptomyces]|uniref:Integral membrane protein n=1 Tax=Streptomyces antibioticus TaxID=1890 RepID=A0ABX3L9X5_STRAT|nr:MULTISPECIES: hypothetical protein [Streptomyces]MBO7937401.1 hypothetical protein [Streptomyces sp. S9]NUV61279.1 hypothetical protein [Streptomyces sp. CAI-85]OOQ47542.1 hypothetical protein AFM16_33055 [Streptomyces antibioticus]